MLIIENNVARAGRDFDKLDGINYEMGATGVPIIVENAEKALPVKK